MGLPVGTVVVVVAGPATGTDGTPVPEGPGVVVVVLGLVVVVFGVVAGRGSGGGQFRDIAFGLALGILMDTFLVRTLLVPSTVVLLGRWNWWPSKMSRKDAVITAPAPADSAASNGAGEPGHEYSRDAKAPR